MLCDPGTLVKDDWAKERTVAYMYLYIYIYLYKGGIAMYRVAGSLRAGPHRNYVHSRYFVFEI